MIFLGYSCRTKAYKFWNFSTHKIIESAHVIIDEFVESEEENKNEPEDYKIFVYYELDTLPNIFDRKNTSSLEIHKSPMVIEMQEVKTESQGPESHSKATELVQTEF